MEIINELSNLLYFIPNTINYFIPFYFLLYSINYFIPFYLFLPLDFFEFFSNFSLSILTLLFDFAPSSSKLKK